MGAMFDSTEITKIAIERINSVESDLSTVKRLTDSLVSLISDTSGMIDTLYLNSGLTLVFNQQTPIRDLHLLNVNSLIIYIGFAITAFAFIINYVSVPRGLLQSLNDLYHSEKLHYSRMSSTEFVKVNANVAQIFRYWGEVNAISYVILSYLVFSILSMVTLLCGRLVDSEPVNLLWRLSLLLLAGLFAFVFKYLLGELRNSSESEWWDINERSNFIKAFSKIANGFIVLFGVIQVIPFLIECDFEFLYFIICICYLVILLAYLLVPYWRRLPIDNLISIFMSSGNLKYSSARRPNDE